MVRDLIKALRTLRTKQEVKDLLDQELQSASYEEFNKEVYLTTDLFEKLNNLTPEENRAFGRWFIIQFVRKRI